MDPDRLPSLGERIRWGNVARALALLAAVVLVLAWPRLTPSEPALPPPPPEPLAVAPVEQEAGGEAFEGPESELGGGGPENREQDEEDGWDRSDDRAGRRAPRPHSAEAEQERGGSGHRSGGGRGGSRGGGRGGDAAPVPKSPRRSAPAPRRPPVPAPTPRRPPAPASTPRPAPAWPSPTPASRPSSPAADPVEREFGFE